MSGTTNVNAEAAVGAAVCWDQYAINLGYSFNYTLTASQPVYLKCAPQNNGSAIIDSTTPIVQSLPSTKDNKIYIYLGVAYSATNIELTVNHPVYYQNGSAVALWTGIPAETTSVTINTWQNVTTP